MQSVGIGAGEVCYMLIFYLYRSNEMKNAMKSNMLMYLTFDEIIWKQ